MFKKEGKDKHVIQDNGASGERKQEVGMLLNVSSSKLGPCGVKGTVLVNMPGPRGKPDQPCSGWERHTGAKPRPLS